MDDAFLFLNLALTVGANVLSLATIALFLREMKRSGRPLVSCAKTFALNFVLFLVPAIALELLILAVAAGAGIGGDMAPLNAVTMLVVVALAYRRTRRTLRRDAARV